MATNFTNKYMQVFQDYNEFSEHSADYVRGEDHIAFLIEENEVIYWLYLEQVWRPLNVRTTTTGQLEDGRTKIAVRLEYIEGGQKYTSVPNIPDPERITSMSHFLEDYPDIEEVNISGTVNLTDLSYAFAGSKIKDFSMLDTSNVTNIVGIFNNIVNEDLDLNIKLDINKINNNNTQDGITVNSINFINSNKDNYTLSLIHFKNCNINVLNLDDFSFDISVVDNNGLTIKTINSNKKVRFSDGANKSNGNNEVNNINCDEFSFGVTSVKANNELIVNCNIAEIDTYGQSNYITENKTILETVNDLTFDISNRGIISFKFGNGIKYPSNISPKLTRYDGTNISNAIGNFWFTTPIVNDDFYADKQYAVSILQYKTTFEEVADVNISSEVDSSLIYMPYNINDSRITFDVSNINIEIYNKLNISFSANEQLKYNKFIIDNSSLDLSEDNLPTLSNSANIYNTSIDYDRVIANEECKISGKYDCNNKGIADLGAFKDITFYNCPTFRLRYELTNRNINFNDCNNINISNYNGESNFNPIKLLDKENNNIIKSVLTARSTWYGSDNIPYFIVDYLENKQVVISNLGDVSYLCWFLNYYDYTSEDKPIIIKANTVLCYKTFNQNNTTKKENIYIDCQDAWLEIGFNPIGYNSHINNIYGNVILRISRSDYNNNPVINNANIQHIDITKVILHDVINRYEMFNESLDDESTIKLITMLEDNTDGQTKTIYMYRSQANIIGEENIAGAVAKNYEIAIIEN